MVAIRERTYSESVTIALAKNEIELLKEFRARLTSEVVTGQADVREIAASLPELADEDLVIVADEVLDSDELIKPGLEFASADE